MKNTLERRSETSERNDGCAKISHKPSADMKRSSPVLMGGLMLSPWDIASAALGTPSAVPASVAAQNWGEAAAKAQSSRKALRKQTNHE